MHARKQGLDYFVAGGDLKEVDEPKRTGGATESESSTTTLVKNKNQNPTPQTKLQFRVPEDRDAAFVPPHWAGSPSPKPGFSVYLEVWKEAPEPIARYNIGSRSASVIGRHVKFAHIQTFHESISRQHAALVYNKEQEKYYIIDLKSFHGTFVNGKKIQPWIPTPVEEGAKLKFGASTRIYSVKTDESGLEKEEDKEEAPEKRDKKVKSDNSNQPPAKRQKTNNSKQSQLEQIQCSHLLVKHRGSRNPVSWRGSEPVTRSKEEAIKILKGYKEQIDSGRATLAELAKRYSDCRSAERGGDLGPFGKGQMQPSFEKAAFALDVGEMSGIVESDSGVHLILRLK